MSRRCRAAQGKASLVVQRGKRSLIFTPRHWLAFVLVYGAQRCSNLYRLHRGRSRWPQQLDRLRARRARPNRSDAGWRRYLPFLCYRWSGTALHSRSCAPGSAAHPCCRLGRRHTERGHVSPPASFKHKRGNPPGLPRLRLLLNIVYAFNTQSNGAGPRLQRLLPLNSQPTSINTFMLRSPSASI